jgi:hypothetical protein
MDIKTVMVLVNGEDKTEKISNIDYDFENGKVKITYRRKNTIYPYNQNSVVVIKKSKVIELDGHAAYVDGMPVYEPQLILDFGERIRIIQYSGESLTVRPQSFLLVRDGAANQAAQQIQTYLRDISQYTTDHPEEEAFLKREIEQLTFVHPESVLSRYLNQQAIEQRTPDTDSIIFPFRFNLSQKAALENAIKNSISVIEGPPGTGKTQTILNIIANLVAVQGKSVAVVSNNNEAVKNVIEKLAKDGYGFLTALLGKGSNQDTFFANMPIAQVDGWDCEEEKEELIQKIEALNVRLNQLLRIDRKKAQLLQELLAWQLEQEHFEEYYVRQDVEGINKLPLFRATPDRIISFLAETSLAKERNQSNKFLYRLRLLFKYGIYDYKKLQQQELSILLSLQREFYRQQTRQLEGEIAALESKLDSASFDALLDEHKQNSERLFRKCLYQSHNELPKPDFNRKRFKVRFQEFIKTFPVILSTTHALRRSIPQNYLLDYVIIDEASQVDLLTGALAFSCCRNVIIVGDVKQLPQITDEKIEPMLKTASPHPVYNYFQHNILSSVISLYGSSLPCETLREHYRCHPRIIEFCNRKYYDGELIPYTSPNLSECPLVLYKTSEGNHMRRVTRGEKKGNYNQRELDVTVEEIIKNPVIAENIKNIGFVTPYRKQANKAEQLLPDCIESDTVHKYQGRQKDVMIMSTVLDSTRDGQMGLEFVDDPQMVNVAVSRAIRQFVLVTDHSLFFKKGKDIGDLIRYIQYSTLDESVIESNIVSVFDLLYRQYSSKLIPLKSKMDKCARYQSEEALRVLLEEILVELQYNRYTYIRGVLLRNLLNTVDLLTPEELNFVNNRASLDFIIFRKVDKSCVLAVEVDGFAFHENNPDQLHRDALKDAILKKHKIPLLRLATNGSSEREKIERALQEAWK